MRNNFPQWVYDLFDMGGYCQDWEDSRNDADCLHHIMCRVCDSPYNAAPLNNFRNHQPEGRASRGLLAIHSREVRKKYLQKTKKYLDKKGYKPNKKDKKFLENNKQYYD